MTTRYDVEILDKGQNGTTGSRPKPAWIEVDGGLIGLGIVYKNSVMRTQKRLHLRKRVAGLCCGGLLLASAHAKAFVSLPSDRSPASIDRGSALASPSHLLYNGETLISADLIDNYNKVQAENKPVAPQDFIPMSLEPSADQGYIASKIADKSISTMMKQPAFKESPLGQTTNSVQNSLNKDISLGSKENGGTQHKFNFQVQAFQSQAILKYEGFTNASLSYSPIHGTTALKLSEKIAPTKEIVLSQELNPTQRLSELNWSWNF